MILMGKGIFGLIRWKCEGKGWYGGNKLDWMWCQSKSAARCSLRRWEGFRWFV